MGHDIYAYRSNEEDEEELAYLRRGAFSELKYTIYEVLECHSMGGSSSGYGDGRYFTQEQLINALSKLPNKEDYEPERNFICDALKGINENNEVYIYFG